MSPIVVCLILLIASLVVAALIITGWTIDRYQRHAAERELGFWDSNVLAALDGSALT
jgi:hypothetical protein